jgi:hypothetical protein
MFVRQYPQFPDLEEWLTAGRYFLDLYRYSRIGGYAEKAHSVAETFAFATEQKLSMIIVR